ncbi:MAG: DUF4837 family protein [Eudoraea sp.]|uniref:DUF4837 family protein n=1 Tax=Eudoraea sp. TaxID=1979955 RepID=UPI003C76BAE5
MKNTIILLLLILLGTSCNDKNKKVYKPESVGALNTLAVVMDNELWEGSVGDKVREHFAEPLIGLTWNEPQFNLEHMPVQVFTGMTRLRRSVLFVSLDSVDIAHVKTDLYATPQKVGVLKGRTKEELIDNIDNYSDKIIASIRETEMEETQRRFSRSLSQDKSLEEEFGISFKLPSIYEVGKREDNFVWIDREIPKGTMNIIVYAMPGNSFSQDSTFVGDIVKMRDSIGKKYIPGPDIPNKTTYMATEKAFAPYVFPAEIAGIKAAEVRGIWEIQNYPMAGPFLSFIINDDKNNRKLIIEAFTFAPATNKRDYMFELEAILKTIQIN